MKLLAKCFFIVILLGSLLPSFSLAMKRSPAKHNLFERKTSDQKSANKNINKRNNEGFTLLHRAAMSGSASLVGYLLKNPFIIVNATNNKGQPPIFFVTDITTLKLFLNDKRTNINIQDNHGRTALINAIEFYGYREEIIELMLEHPDINTGIKTLDGTSAIEKAIDGKNENIIRLLLKKIRDPNELFDVKRYLKKKYRSGEFLDKTLRIINKKLESIVGCEKKIDINNRDKKGLTLLHYYTLDNEFKTINSLFTMHDINVNAVNNEGQSPLFFADNPDIVAFFLSDKRVDVNVQDIKGRTALIRAIMDGNDEKVTLLLQHDDIDISAQTLQGHSALTAALSRGYDDIIIQLLNKTNDLEELQWAWEILDRKYDQGPCIDTVSKRIMDVLQDKIKSIDLFVR